MDPLSTIASIIAVLQLSDKVIKYISAAKGAKDDRKCLREEIRACSNILQQLKDDADDSEEGKEWSATIKALEAPDAPLHRLRATLSLVKAKLQPKDGVVKVLKWPFQEKEVQKIVDSIEREKALLSIALQNNSRKLLQEITKSSKDNNRQLGELIELFKESQLESQNHFGELKSEVSGTLRRIDSLRDRQDHQQGREERRTILNWLNAADYTSQQHDLITQRKPGTGQWILDSKVYQAWAQADRQTLFCPGIPGAGKTFITATVIEHLSEQYRDDNTTAVIYLYCNFKRKDEQKLYDLLANLLRQLVEGQEVLPAIMKDLYNRHQQKRTRPPLEEILKSIHSVATSYFKVFVFVDALDECQPVDGCRSKLISELFSLQEKRGINLFATSRDIPEIVQRFEGVEMLRILASSEDVRIYLDGRMDEFSNCQATLQEEIKVGIIESIRGMFLLAKLHLDSLVGQKSPKAVRTALKKLPSGSDAYDYAYKDAMERIQGQHANQEELAKQVLSWITCAKRPLTTSEIQHALAVEVGEPELDEENISQIEYIMSVCAGLVTVDEEGGIIRLVHYTTQEYFERTQKHWFPHADEEMTAICITYLSFDAFKEGPCLTEDCYQRRTEKYKLYLYAASTWGHHARAIQTKSWQFIDFSEQSNQMNAALQASLVLERGWWHPRRLGLSYMTTNLHFTAYHGVEQAVADCLTKFVDINGEDSDDRTPLSYAAENGHEAVVRLFLRNGADMDRCGRSGMTPMYLAARNGHKTVVSVLLKNNAAVNQNLPREHSPLAGAAEGGHESIFKLLLKHGAEVNSKDDYNYTPLMLAALQGYVTIVRLLLDNGADVNARDNEGRTALLYAAQYHGAIVKLLVDNGADVNSMSFEGDDTPLISAASGGSEAAVKLLVSKGASIDYQNPRGSTALSEAAWFGHEAIVKVLLENGAALDSTNKSFETPLMCAAGQGHEAMVRLLLEKGAKVNSKVLLQTVRNGHENVVRLLLEKGTEVNSEALSFAAFEGYEAIVKLLLDEGVSKESKDGKGRTPLALAASRGHEDVIRLLLNHGVEVDSVDDLGRTPLAYATVGEYKHIIPVGGNIPTAKLFPGERVASECRKRRKRLRGTTIWSADKPRYEAIVKLLLESGANPDGFPPKLEFYDLSSDDLSIDNSSSVEWSTE